VIDDQSHYRWLAVAYARGALGEAVAAMDDDAAIAAAEQAGHKLHRFKRSAELPRVRAMLGTLRGLAPESLLDVGSGRGVFLWPMLDGLGDLRVTSIDVLEDRARQIAAVARGGVERLAAVRMDGARLGFAAGAFDVVTVLEVLEHVDEPARVASELVRVARRAVLATVPSHEDDNPEHVRLFSAQSLKELFEAAGARRVVVDGVRGHLTAVAMTDREDEP
jgi:2-polyprenyl-3-methyl-5-hydroxy-6-metoxy-1,4-benzoquinol methylase